MIDGSLGFLLNKGTLALHKQLNRNFAKSDYDITFEQWSILTLLHHCDGISQVEIADKSLKDKVSITKIVDNLVKRRLVFRSPDEKDRRIKRIFLTKEGKKLIPKLKKIAIATLKEGFKGINSDDLATFKNVLTQINKNITGEDLIKFLNKNKGRWK